MVAHSRMDALTIDCSSLDIVFDLIAQPAIGIDLTERRILHWNAAAEVLFGQKKTDVVGRSIDVLYPDTLSSQQFFDALCRETEGQEIWRTPFRFRVHRNSRLADIDAEVTAKSFPRSQTGLDYALLVLQPGDPARARHGEAKRDPVEEELRAANARLQEMVMERTRLLHLLEEVAGVANGAATIDDALETTIDKICSETSLPCPEHSRLMGHIYRKLTTAITRRLNYWKFPDSEKYAELRDVSDAVEFKPGVGLIGRVLTSRKLEWIGDLGEDSTDPRAETARRLGLKSAFAFPVLAGKEIVAVMEIFSTEKFELGAMLRDVMSLIGVELGRIIERKQAQEKLRQNELLSAIGLTASKLAHDISNPLNGMYTAAQLLEQFFKTQKTPVEDAVVNTLQDLKKEVDRARSWLQEFRVLTKPMKFDFEMADLAEIAREVVTQEGRRYQERGVALGLEFAPDLPKLKVDREKIKQALVNLCQNAVDAMPHGGQLTLRGHRSSNAVFIEVADTGSGVPERLKIFEVFTSTKPGATGLGLPVVQQIVVGHQGSITYTSQPGKGTTFRLSLPL
ncbi:MAG TPA: ATP-binding protein [Candidatus Binatia bacterium]|nr:ATP-binding protein [Candidatus Binatia bacterium]